MNFNKLHIKLLSVALLVTLTCYSGNEDIVLPQQFTSEYVVFAYSDNNAALYPIAYSLVVISEYVFTDFNYEQFLKAKDSDEKIVYTKYQLLSQGLKKKRLMVAFNTERLALGSIENRIFI